MLRGIVAQSCKSRESGKRGCGSQGLPVLCPGLRSLVGGVFSLSGSSWNENSSSGRITNCLVLKNLTPQVGHTLGGGALAWGIQAPPSQEGQQLNEPPPSLPAQIDGSTLRTLCMQHGPLITFHLNLPHGNALVRYSSKEEVMKAQKSLHM